jgi:hypothetical protein
MFSLALGSQDCMLSGCTPLAFNCGRFGTAPERFSHEPFLKLLAK